MSEPKSFQESVDNIVREMRDLLISKQKDYGPKNILEAGVIGVLIRANDKMSRLKHLYGMDDGSYQLKSTNHESIKDSWIDLANYAIIAQLLIDGNFTKPMEKTDEKR